MKILKFIAGFFQDQKGNTSRKAVALYFSLFLLFRIVNGMLKGSKIDANVLLAIVVVILVALGAISAEFFNKNASLLDFKNRKGNQDESIQHD